jgi:hypothetical protein
VTDQVATTALEASKALLEEAEAAEQQLELLAPPTPEEMAEAREDLGPDAGRLAVLRHAREIRGRGRPKGSRNKRTDDFARYILSFGQDPAITMMQIQSTPPEVLIQASEQRRVHSFQKNGTPNIVTERLTYDQAQSLRIRCAEALMPYIHQKKPVAIDHTIRGVDVIEEPPRQLTSQPVDGEFVEVATPGDEAGSSDA